MNYFMSLILIFIILTHISFGIAHFWAKKRYIVTGAIFCGFRTKSMFRVSISSNSKTIEKHPLATTIAKDRSYFALPGQKVIYRNLGLFIKIYHNCFPKHKNCMGVTIKKVPDHFVKGLDRKNRLYSVGQIDLTKEKFKLLKCYSKAE
uniref:NTR domain-containing protein n=1 Tax=Strongyloides stercoralis TaxID=6248 RepID=A0A0K0ELU4_STRER